MVTPQAVSLPVTGGKEPVWRVLESPAVAARLALLLETMPVAAAEYKGVIGARDVIVPILRSVQLAEQ